MILRALTVILLIYSLSFYIFGPKPNQKNLSSSIPPNTSCVQINDNLIKITFSISRHYWNRDEYKAIENLYGNKIDRIDFIIFILKKKLNIFATVHQKYHSNNSYCKHYVNNTCVAKYPSIATPRILPRIDIPEDLNILDSEITRWSDEVYEIEINQKLKYRRRYTNMDSNIFPGIWREYGFNEYTDQVVKYLTDFSQKLAEECQMNIKRYGP